MSRATAKKTAPEGAAANFPFLFDFSEIALRAADDKSGGELIPLIRMTGTRGLPADHALELVLAYYAEAELLCFRVL